MTDHDLAILELTIWALAIYVLVLTVVAVTRRFILDGDVVADAQQVLHDQESIDSYVADWLTPAPKTNIREAIDIAQQRVHQ